VASEGTSVRPIDYGGTFSVWAESESPDHLKIGMVRLGSSTHGNNMDQRFIWLTSETPLLDSEHPGQSSLIVRAPQSGAIAPPGDYMIVVVDQFGVPSEAKFVRLRERVHP
jgi:Domain of unknown function (DUF1929)